MRQLYGLPHDAVVIVHNGIEAADPWPRNGRAGGHPGESDLRIAFVGRLVPFKRVDRLLLAMSRTVRRDRLRLLLAGTGPLERELRVLAVSLGLESHVEFLGQRRDVRKILSTVDVLVQPSEAEPFGIAILEACAEGVLPVVFADAGGALEALPPDGVVVKDEDELASALDSLIDAPALSAESRRRRAAWVREQFSIAATASSFQRLYESVLSRTC
jgi:glycosyltransferase involved in cell wall biosynthesis